MTLIAFHGKQHIKDGLLASLRAHKRSDDFRRGTYGDWHVAPNGKVKRTGCAVGCTLNGSDHALYERYYGLPKLFGLITDNTFERLPDKHFKSWPVRVIEAVPIGAVLDQRFYWRVVYAVWKKRRKAIMELFDSRILNDGVSITRRQLFKDTEASIIARTRDPGFIDRKCWDNIMWDTDSSMSAYVLGKIAEALAGRDNIRDNIQGIMDDLVFLGIPYDVRLSDHVYEFSKIFIAQLRLSKPRRKKWTNREAANSFNSAVAARDFTDSYVTSPGMIPVPPFDSLTATQLGFPPYNASYKDTLREFMEIGTVSVIRPYDLFNAPFKPTLDERTLPHSSPR